MGKILFDSDLLKLLVDAIFLLSDTSHPNFATSNLRKQNVRLLRPHGKMFLASGSDRRKVLYLLLLNH